MHCDRTTLHALVHLTVQDNAALSEKKLRQNLETMAIWIELQVSEAIFRIRASVSFSSACSSQRLK